MSVTLGRYLECQSHAWHDAKQRLNEGEIFDIADMITFPQGWPSTSKGFGGMAGQMMTRDVTTVIMVGREMLVYVGERYAYTVYRPTKAFHDAVMRRNTPGRSEFLRNMSTYDDHDGHRPHIDNDNGDS